MSPYATHGTDVSFYQDKKDTPQTINFQAMRDMGGAKFAIIRAGQNLWEDSLFDTSWKNAKGILPRGSYWFYDSRVDPKLQAKKWLASFNDPNDLGEFYFWCDYEDRYGGPFGRWQDWYNFMEHLKELRPGIKLGVYTGYYYWLERTVGAGIPKASLNYFAQYPLWVANYGVKSPLVPAPWKTWTLWQYTDNGDGTKYGVESLNIDLNYFNGDADAFRAFCGGLPTEPETPEPPKKPDTIARLEVIRRSGKVEVFENAGSLRQELTQLKQYALELDREAQTGEPKS